MSRRVESRNGETHTKLQGPTGSQMGHSIAPMWRRSLCLGGDTTGARWVKQHLTHVCTSAGTPSPERVEGTRAWCEKADAPEYQQARGQSARSCMVKADCLKPSCGGFPLALRARYWPLSSTLSRLLLCRGKASVDEARPVGERRREPGAVAARGHPAAAHHQRREHGRNGDRQPGGPHPESCLSLPRCVYRGNRCGLRIG